MGIRPYEEGADERPQEESGMNGYYLIGEQLGHSFSADIHRRFGRYDYELKELSPAELGPFLEARDFAGLNVTIPYKEAVLPYLDRLDEQAAAIGAVNTVVNRGGVLWGYNTDFGGMRAALARGGIGISGKTVLILGTGGSSKTALAVCRALGAAQIHRVSRTGKDGALTYAEAYARFGRLLPRDSLSDAPHPSAPGAPQGPVVINCSPVGMWPDVDGMPLDLKAFELSRSEGSEASASPSSCQPSSLTCHLSPVAWNSLSAVFDCVYNPLRTRLVLEARARSIPAAGGLEMLVKQAALACALFTDAAVDENQVDIICNSLGRKQENIVLIGMPGAGKTSVARILAQKCGRPFVDIDEEIAKRAGKPIPAIFAEDGETAFRDLEAELVRALAPAHGRVIAAGGGTILRPENVRRMQQNGRLVFLDRPLEALEPSPERPLGDTAEKVAALYGARYARYAAAADLTVPVAGTPEDAADAILAAL